jgi:hypothetical protein
LYIGGVDYSECRNDVWYDWSPLKTGDQLDIKVAEINDPSMPVKTSIDRSIKRPETKLKFFRELEVELKKQGLL